MHLWRLRKRRQRLLLLLVQFLQFLFQTDVLGDVVGTGIAIDRQRPVLESCRSQLWNACAKCTDTWVFGTGRNGRATASTGATATRIGSYRTVAVMTTVGDVASVVR